MFGSNPIAVLATIILMSYTKLLQTSVDVLSYVELDTPTGVEKVWSPDPNIQDKHIAFSIVSIIVIAFLILPFIFLLMFGYQLQALSGKKCFFWFNRLKPLLDAYYAPYNKKTRYWTGLLLLIRAILFISIVVIEQLGLSLVLTATLFTTVVVVSRLSNRIYNKLYLEVLEASFFLNICVVANMSYYVQETNHSQLTLTYVSVGIAFAEFVGIVLFHVCLRLKVVDLFQRRWKRVKVTMKKPPSAPEENMSASFNMDGQNTVTVVELREPLLEDEQSL